MFKEHLFPYMSIIEYVSHEYIAVSYTTCFSSATDLLHKLQWATFCKVFFRHLAWHLLNSMLIAEIYCNLCIIYVTLLQLITAFESILGDISPVASLLQYFSVKIHQLCTHPKGLMLCADRIYPFRAVLIKLNLSHPRQTGGESTNL